ncbi:zinc finger, CCHC-type containing protein [Tanacetum coccineum]
MAFDLRPTEDVLPWPGNANMAFDLRPTEDVLPWPGNANMAFDLRPTEDVLPWPGNANMAFDLRPTEDVLPWPGNANMAFDLVPDLQCLLRTFYIRRYLRDMHEDNYNERISAALVIGTCRVDKGSAAYDVSHCEVNFQMQGHVHFKRMQEMSKDGLISAFDMDTEKCKTCMLNKITKKPFQNVKRETKVLELIHNDLCDMHATPSLMNKKYFVTFIDDASRFCYVYLLHTKDEALDKFKVFKTEVELQQVSQIKRFRTDRGVRADELDHDGLMIWIPKLFVCYGVISSNYDVTVAVLWTCGSSPVSSGIASVVFMEISGSSDEDGDEVKVKRLKMWVWLSGRIEAVDSDGHLRSCPSDLGGVVGGRGTRSSVRLAGSRRIRVGSWNVGSLTRKLFELGDALGRHKVDIACFQETKWKGSRAREVYRIMAISVVIEGETVNVISAYASQVGLSDVLKKRFWDALDELVRECPTDQRLIIGGDLYNISYFQVIYDAI